MAMTPAIANAAGIERMPMVAQSFPTIVNISINRYKMQPKITITFLVNNDETAPPVTSLPQFEAMYQLQIQNTRNSKSRNSVPNITTAS